MKKFIQKQLKSIQIYSVWCNTKFQEFIGIFFLQNMRYGRQSLIYRINIMMQSVENQQYIQNQIGEQKFKEINQVVRTIQKIFKNNAELLHFYIDLRQSKGRLKSKDLRKLYKILIEFKNIHETFKESKDAISAITFTTNSQVLCLRRLLFRLIEKMNGKFSFLQQFKNHLSNSFMKHVTTLGDCAEKLLEQFETLSGLQQLITVFTVILKEDVWIQKQIYLQIVDQNYVASIQQFEQIFSKGGEKLFNRPKQIEQRQRDAAKQLRQSKHRSSIRINEHTFALKRKFRRRVSRYKFGKIPLPTRNSVNQFQKTLKIIINPLTKFIQEASKKFLSSHTFFTSQKSKKSQSSSDISDFSIERYREESSKSKSKQSIAEIEPNIQNNSIVKRSVKRKWSNFYKVQNFQASNKMNTSSNQLPVQRRASRRGSLLLTREKSNNQKKADKFSFAIPFDQEIQEQQKKLEDENQIQTKKLIEISQETQQVITQNWTVSQRIDSRKNQRKIKQTTQQQIDRLLLIYEQNHANRLNKENKETMNTDINSIQRQNTPKYLLSKINVSSVDELPKNRKEKLTHKQNFKFRWSNLTHNHSSFRINTQPNNTVKPESMYLDYFKKESKRDTHNSFKMESMYMDQFADSTKKIANNAKNEDNNDNKDSRCETQFKITSKNLPSSTFYKSNFKKLTNTYLNPLSSSLSSKKCKTRALLSFSQILSSITQKSQKKVSKVLTQEKQNKKPISIKAPKHYQVYDRNHRRILK